jgi:hypothetical protein
MQIPSLRERPQLPPDLIGLQDAFDFLSISRPIGFNLGPIPITEITAYASVYPLSMPVADFVDLIRTIDVRHLAHLNKDGTRKDTRSRD